MLQLHRQSPFVVSQTSKLALASSRELVRQSDPAASSASRCRLGPHHIPLWHFGCHHFWQYYDHSLLGSSPFQVLRDFSWGCQTTDTEQQDNMCPRCRDHVTARPLLLWSLFASFRSRQSSRSRRPQVCSDRATLLRGGGVGMQGRRP